MSDFRSNDPDFIKKLESILSENLSDDKFGVTELASATNMSRSNLLRKVKKLTGKSVSNFIREYRLQQAMKMLSGSSLTSSEVAYETGFSSSSYFIKCFREYYGYPPGEVGKNHVEKSDRSKRARMSKKTMFIVIPIVAVSLFILFYFLFFRHNDFGENEMEKSIAVLPFINDSDDESNIYIINGLMESILNHLQRIEDLRVISRTSVEKYRHSHKTIAEMAEELNVNYFVEGSGQKIGNQIFLHIQLIDAGSDTHIWSEQYKRDAEDIFDLQIEIAEQIASEIQAIITPEEKERIEKRPTDDLIAYDYFLKGLDLFYKQNPEDLNNAVDWFKKAIERDPEFARAYADIAISYYFMDYNEKERKFSAEINYYSDKALLYDSRLEQSLIAKALFYMYTNEHLSAEQYLEKALEYNPNSVLVINILSDFYANILPNTEKYLEYALKGIQLDIGVHDSLTESYIFLHVGNALIQTGFIEEAEYYINKSLEFETNNLYSEMVKAYLFFAQSGSLEDTKDHLLKTLKRDTTRLDIITEIGKIYYYLRDYQHSYDYFKQFKDIQAAYNLDLYRGEDAKIALVYSETGHHKESEQLFEKYRQYAEADKTIYKHLSLCVYHSYYGNREESLKHLKLFSEQDNYFYWVILFLKIDPLIDNIKDLPETKKILDDLELRFWERHKEFKLRLKEKNLLMCC